MNVVPENNESWSPSDSSSPLLDTAEGSIERPVYIAPHRTDDQSFRDAALELLKEHQNRVK